MFGKPSVLSFFPTFVWVYDLNEGDTADMCAGIANHIEKAMPTDTLLARGHSVQSGTLLHRLPEFQPLCQQVEAAAQGILEFLEFRSAPLKVTGCWANVSGHAAHHREHSHPNNFLSGAYYVKTPSGGDSINFHDPRTEAHTIAPHVSASSTKNASAVTIDVQPGRLVLFPAWLRHSVDPNTSQELRMSVSFNLMFDNFAEEQSVPRFDGEFQTSQ